MDEELPESEWTIEDWKTMRDALVTENEWFKAQLAAIPWNAIRGAYADVLRAAKVLRPVSEESLSNRRNLWRWLDAHAPKEADSE